MTQTLLIELLTEELPPKALNNLGNHFAQSIAEGLEKAQLIDGATQYTAYASPRRLAVSVANVKPVQADQHVVRKGVSVAAGMKDGVPTKALEGFARSCSVEIGSLKIIHDGKQDVYAHEFTQAGQTLAALLGEIINTAIKKLPIPKVMRWGSSTHTFVRPVHGLVILHGANVVPANVLGLQSGNTTLGHRFLSDGLITIENADSYAEQMREQGKVIASFATRKAAIQTALNQHAGRLNATVAADEALLDEVSALVEWPVVLEAGFEAHFLEVPQECLILTMQQNQKYFPLLDANGRLMNRFLLVSNLEAADPSHIIHGNERVLRARLSDAEFFYKQDQKNTLESRLPKLANVVYHNKIGSQAERIERLQSIAAHTAAALGADRAQAERAARLAKADLVTEMVGEFPELQGTMGRYYARHDGESEAVADAIAEHYRPRFAGDALPASPTGLALALADKLETLAGIWGIGQRPTGDKDPFALRRHALGVVRILIEGKLTLSLPALLEQAFSVFDKLPAPAAADTEPSDKAAATGKKGRKEAAPQPFTADVPGLSAFVADRLRSYLRDRGFAGTDIEAVLATGLDRLDLLEARLAALAAFRRLPAFESLTAANKRIGNILRKSAGEGAADDKASVDPALLKEAAERDLNDALVKLQPQVQGHLQQQDFTAALQALAALQAPVDAFFEQVMVNAEDPALRRNRLALLGGLHALMNQVADLSQL